MAKDVLITPAGGIVEWKDSGNLQASIYELNGDLYLDVEDGVIVLGDGTPTNIELGNASVAVDFDFLGGGTITSSGNTLNIGASGDTINLNIAGVTYNFANNIVTTADYTASDVLTKIKTVDGAGSGLDADLWDGNQFADYLDQAVKTTSSPTFGNITVSGNLTVNGTTTNLNSVNLVIEDKNIILGDVTTPSDTTADGGGITLKGATDKTITWVNSTGRWTSNQTFEAPILVSTQTTGTAPLTVASTTVVTNLNADLLDGQQGTYYTNASSLSSGTVSTARLGTGTADATTWLRGDGTWQLGPLGYTGSRGPTGYTGSASTVIGYTGSLGYTGSASTVVGYTGSRGYTGSQGYTGSKGDQGGIGYTGSEGNNAGLRYNFSTTTTDADPGQGIFRFNNATIASVTQIYIDIANISGVDFTAYIDTWDDSTNAQKGYLIIDSNNNSDTTKCVFSLTAVTTATGYRKLTVTYLSGAAPSDTEACTIQFARTGAIGYTGSSAVGGASVTTSVTPPSTPSDGDLWWYEEDGQLKIYYNDGNTSQWVDASSSALGYTGSKGALQQWAVKTSNYTAIDGDRFIANTAAGSFTVTLPSTPSAGAYVQITDGGDWSVNNLLINRNGSTIENVADTLAINISNVSVEFIYDGSTWQFVCSTGPQGAPGPESTESAIAFSIALS